MLSSRSNLFETLKIFFANIPFFANRRQITYRLWSLEENEYAAIKYPINLKHLKKTSINDDTDSKNQEIALIPIFYDF